MKFKFLEKREVRRASRPSTLVTKSSFFNSDDRVAYFDPSTFNELVHELKTNAPALFNQFNEMFECFKERATVTFGRKRRIHTEHGSAYYHLKMRKGNYESEATIYEVEGLGRFIKDYIDGIISIDFTLDELIEEANS
jgi:hypothetical protein